MSAAFETAERQVKLYVELMDEQWRRDFDEAQSCLDFEEGLAFGLYLYDRFTRLIDSWRELAVKAAAAGNTAAYDPKAHEATEHLIRWWLRPCDEVEKRIQFYERRHYQIPDAAKFRSCCAEARWFLASPDEVGRVPELIDARSAAEAEHRAGDTVDLEF